MLTIRVTLQESALVAGKPPDYHLHYSTLYVPQLPSGPTVPATSEAAFYVLLYQQQLHGGPRGQESAAAAPAKWTIPKTT